MKRRIVVVVSSLFLAGVLGFAALAGERPEERQGKDATTDPGAPIWDEALAKAIEDGASLIDPHGTPLFVNLSASGLVAPSNGGPMPDRVIVEFTKDRDGNMVSLMTVMYGSREFAIQGDIVIYTGAVAEEDQPTQPDGARVFPDGPKNCGMVKNADGNLTCEGACPRRGDCVMVTVNDKTWCNCVSAEVEE